MSHADEAGQAPDQATTRLVSALDRPDSPSLTVTRRVHPSMIRASLLGL
jgi:hypothetical protein